MPEIGRILKQCSKRTLAEKRIVIEPEIEIGSVLGRLVPRSTHAPVPVQAAITFYNIDIRIFTGNRLCGPVGTCIISQVHGKGIFRPERFNLLIAQLQARQSLFPPVVYRHQYCCLHHISQASRQP